ncbi:MAG TPA: serine/threonine-protein kinase [Sandaracinaceae bacterium LLY-WYZ-13_1]|nr:serine/threonine-protein kinase [Sandaracinaceae bacterium LLY-WYZ-13_1]
MERGVLRAPDPGAPSMGGAGSWEQLATRRLAWLAGLGVGVGALAWLLGQLRQPNLGPRAGTERPLELAPMWAALCLVVFFVARAERISPARRLDVGLGYLVVSCFMAGLFRHWLPYAESDVVRGVSPVTIAILFFAVVVPVPPARMAVAATLGAASDALALALTGAWLDQPTPPWNLWVWLLAPNGFGVVVAVITSVSLHRLAETVRRARQMGAYRLVEKLGAGGMGEVWRAEHRGLARPAAIKLVRPELLGAHDDTDTQRMLTRFAREAKATAALTSPHTIGVYDYGRAEDGSFYYVMELLEGMDLETLVQHHGRLPPERAAHLLLQVCDSLRDAHAQGVVHRDIKPANVMVCRQGTAPDFVKVLDFGLVKVEEPGEGAQDAKLTDAGVAMGTPAYMAREVAHGKEATPRSDVYAFGCLAYWLLTGRMVFADDPHPMQQILAHVQQAPEPPSAHAPGIDPALDALVLACLAKDPADRPSDASAVERALRDTRLAERWTEADAAAWWASVRSSKAPAPALSPTLPADVAHAPTAPVREG